MWHVEETSVLVQTSSLKISTRTSYLIIVQHDIKQAPAVGIDVYRKNSGNYLLKKP